MPTPWSSLLSDFSALTVAAVPDGAEALALAELVRSETRKGLDAVYIARDGQRLQQLQVSNNPDTQWRQGRGIGCAHGRNVQIRCHTLSLSGVSRQPTYTRDFSLA